MLQFVILSDFVLSGVQIGRQIIDHYIRAYNMENILGITIGVYIMRLSMSCPTSPRSGRGGDLQKLDDELHNFGLQILTNSYYLPRESLTYANDIVYLRCKELG